MRLFRFCFWMFLLYLILAAAGESEGATPRLTQREAVSGLDNYLQLRDSKIVCAHRISPRKWRCRVDLHAEMMNEDDPETPEDDRILVILHFWQTYHVRRHNGVIQVWDCASAYGCLHRRWATKQPAA